MINFLKKYLILIVLLLLVIILFFLKFFYGNKDDKNSTILITEIPTLVPTQIIYEVDNPNIEEGTTIVLPYMGEKMEIAGVKSPGVLDVLISKEEDKNEAENEVKEWQKKYPIFTEYTMEFTIKNLD